MNESEFVAMAEQVFERIETALEDGDVDCSVNEGVMELECDDGSKLIVSRHIPNREIWLAARSGGFHYRWEDGDWRDTRGGPTFLARLADCLAAQSGEHIRF